jgi:hypothetical protein
LSCSDSAAHGFPKLVRIIQRKVFFEGYSTFLRQIARRRIGNRAGYIGIVPPIGSRRNYDAFVRNPF